MRPRCPPPGSQSRSPEAKPRGFSGQARPAPHLHPFLPHSFQKAVFEHLCIWAVSEAVGSCPTHCPYRWTLPGCRTQAVSCSAVTTLKSVVVQEQGALHFHLALDPTHCMATLNRGANPGCAGAPWRAGGVPEGLRGRSEAGDDRKQWSLSCLTPKPCQGPPDSSGHPLGGGQHWAGGQDQQSPREFPNSPLVRARPREHGAGRQGARTGGQGERKPAQPPAPASPALQHLPGLPRTQGRTWLSRFRVDFTHILCSCAQRLPRDLPTINGSLEVTALCRCHTASGRRGVLVASAGAWPWQEMHRGALCAIRPPPHCKGFSGGREGRSVMISQEAQRGAATVPGSRSQISAGNDTVTLLRALTPTCQLPRARWGSPHFSRWAKDPPSWLESWLGCQAGTRWPAGAGQVRCLVP